LTIHKITKVEFYKYSQKNGEKQVEIVRSDSGWNEIILKIICIDILSKLVKFASFDNLGRKFVLLVRG
jgi:hypothetical protein